jgi:TRAP-type C4-dicarboxylate transport system permease small subunit
MVIKSIVFPEWWLYAPVPLCFALLAVEFTRRILYGGVLEGSGPHA